MTKDREITVLDYMQQIPNLFNSMVQGALTPESTDSKEDSSGTPDPTQALDLLSGDVKVDAARLMSDQMTFMAKQVELWQNATRAMLGEKVQPVISEAQDDYRFRDSDWSDNPVYSYLKQAYLLNAQMLQNTVDSLSFADEKTAEQVRFYTRQYLSSISPGNYALTNPEVFRQILATGGKNLAQGMENLLRDLEHSPAEALKVTQTDSRPFNVGENLAATPGKVVFQNDLIQLIHYTPTTDEIYQHPVLITPPFINKYYILDLDEKKSLVRWLLSRGYPVFMISWVNATPDLADKDFGDYMKEGPVAAMDIVEKITGTDRINMVGYCVGGTLQAAAAAWLRARGDKRVNSLTFLTTLLDFSQSGELGNYISEQTLPIITSDADRKGVFDGRILGLGFNLLRENSLFWPCFINNYLKGKEPPAFDILFWNGDSSNVPAALFKQYLRMCYIDNALKEPGAIVIDGTSVDLGKIDVPALFLATASDHIVLWQGAYKGVQLLSGPVQFVLAESGHLAGVINPIEGGKYGHWLNSKLPASAEAWLEGAEQHDGSWWPHWDQWLAPLSGKKVSGQKTSGQKMTEIRPGTHPDYPALENAPGSYVKVRL